MNDFERILGVAIGFGLVEADVGQFALDDVDQAAVLRLCAPAAVLRQRRKRRMLVFQMAQNVLQPVLHPSEVEGGAVIGQGFKPFEQIRHALLEMGESRCVVGSDRHSVNAVRQRPQRAFEMLNAFA